MRIPINLASQPYENVRPLYAGLTMAAALFVVLSAALAWTMRSSRDETRMLTEQSAKLDRESAALNSEQGDLTKWLARPEVQDIRSQSDYLNSMIVRKSLSWTQLFMDLEKVLPNRVQVTTIHPGLAPQKQAELNLSVSSLSLPPLVQFLKNLESSTRFDKPVVASQRFPGERAQDPSIVLELQVDYRPDGAEQSDQVSNEDALSQTAPVPVAAASLPVPVASAVESFKKVITSTTETVASKPTSSSGIPAASPMPVPVPRNPRLPAMRGADSPETVKEAR